MASLKSQIALAKTAALASQAESTPGGGAWLVAELEGVAAADLQGAAQSLQQQLGEAGAVVLVSPSSDGKVHGASPLLFSICHIALFLPLRHACTAIPGILANYFYLAVRRARFCCA